MQYGRAKAERCFCYEYELFNEVPSGSKKKQWCRAAFHRRLRRRSFLLEEEYKGSRKKTSGLSKTWKWQNALRHPLLYRGSDESSYARWLFENANPEGLNA